MNYTVDYCSKFRRSALVSVFRCSSCKNAFAVKVCGACWDTLAGACDVQLILFRQGDLLGSGGAASSSSLALEGEFSYVGTSCRHRLA